MQNGTQTSLRKKLKEKVEAERLKTEQIFKESLELLSKNLQESSQNELHTIETAIKTEAQETTKNLHHHYKILSIAFGKEWIRTVLITAASILGITLGTWLLLMGVACRINNQLEELDQIQSRIRESRQTLEYLNKDTFGINLNIEKKGRFIVLPEGYTVDTRWKNGDKQSLRLIEK